MAELRKAVKDKGLSDMVNFTGRIPDAEMIEILSTADVCVNPDKPCEMNDISTMIKITEYMALGKPIVQSDLKEGKFTAMEASLYANDRLGAKDFAEKIRKAGKHAVRCATMRGKEMNFDPDALLQNLVVGMLGYWTEDGLSSDEWANPPRSPRPSPGSPATKQAT